MAGKVKVTKEGIIQCALDITRTEGIAACNARRIGKALNCSLQPVYYYFGTMDMLRTEIAKAANELYNKRMRVALSEQEKKFRAVGLNYIRFASEEKELFKLLFMSNANNVSNFKVEVDDNANDIVREIISEYGLTREQAIKLHFELWIATHGIASMIATDYMVFPSEQIVEMLEDYCSGIIMKIKGARHD